MLEGGGVLSVRQGEGEGDGGHSERDDHEGGVWWGVNTALLFIGVMFALLTVLG